MGNSNDDLGLRGEALAERVVRKAGLRLLARRFRTRTGEIDLIMSDGALTVFVEVKSLRSEKHEQAVDRVTASKQQRLVRAARLYLRQSGREDQAARFDVVTVVGEADETPRVIHYPGAFEPGGW